MHYAVVIPTNRGFSHIKPLLLSLQCQLCLPTQIIIVLDRAQTASEYNLYRQQVLTVFEDVSSLEVTLIHSRSDSSFFVGKGASYVRNYGRRQVTSPYMMFIDDDNTFDEYFAYNIFARREANSAHSKKSDLTTLVVPLQYNDTSTYVRVAVADGFNFALCRPHWLTTSLMSTDDRYVSLQLASSNCLVGATALFAQFPFDETVPFVYEDLIMTGEMSQGGVTLVCDTWTSLIHHHGERSRLASLYINTPARAYHKAKHRIMLIHTIGSSGDKLLFYLIGVRGQTGWLIMHILVYAPLRDWLGLCGALWRGTLDGIRKMWL